MNKREKSDNRRALPKFFGVLLIAMVIGALTGGVVGYLGGAASPETVKASVHTFLAGVSPLAQWILAVCFTAAELVLYRKAKRRFAAWDGEDEAVMEQADRKLSWMLLLTSLHLVLAFILSGFGQMLGDESDFLFILLGFIAAMACCIIMQQKAVDLTRKMNPEKKGSVYDMKFHEKWLDSCDENERRQIGQAAYKAFTVTNSACFILWILLILLGNMLDLGVLPMAVTMLICGVSQISFHLEVMKLSQHK